MDLPHDSNLDRRTFLISTGVLGAAPTLNPTAEGLAAQSGPANARMSAPAEKLIPTFCAMCGPSAGCGILGGIISGRFLGDGSLADLGLAILGLLLGYIFGIVAGILAIKFIFHQRGSLVFAIIAAIIWTGVSILIAIPFNLSDNLVSTIDCSTKGMANQAVVIPNNNPVIDLSRGVLSRYGINDKGG